MLRSVPLSFISLSNLSPLLDKTYPILIHRIEAEARTARRVHNKSDNRWVSNTVSTPDVWSHI